MITPPFLQPGDTIYLLSTARKMELSELEFAIETIETWGFRVKFGKTIGAVDHQFAGNDALRTADFNSAIHDPETNAILCVRGGYGSVRIVDDLDWKHLLRHPKWIIGYSDVTTLHLHAHQLGLKTIHASMPVNFKTNTPEALTSLKNCLTGNFELVDNFKVHRSGRMNGQLIGGNLSIIYSLLGSKSVGSFKGKVLFIEDLDEYLYHIDRMMMNLFRNGVFEGLSGLIIGGMTDMNDNAIPFGKTALEIIFEHVEQYDFPVIYDYPAGHLDDHRALVLGESLNLEI